MRMRMQLVAGLWTLEPKVLKSLKNCTICAPNHYSYAISDPSFIVHLGSQHNLDFIPILNGLKDDPSTIFEAPTANI